MESVTLRILPYSDYIIPISASETVSDIKDKFSFATGISSFSLKLIFRGNILNDINTLKSYGITDKAILYLVIKNRNQLTKEQKDILLPPNLLIHELNSIIEVIRQVNYPTFKEEMKRIKEILSNQFLIYYGQINKKIQEQVEEIAEFCQKVRPPQSDDTILEIARIQDMIFDQFEGSPEGYKSIVSTVEEVDADDLIEGNEEEEEEINEFLDEDAYYIFNDEYSLGRFGSQDTDTKLDYAPRISESPLPVPFTHGWFVNRNF